MDTKRVRLPGGVSSLSNSADWCEIVVGTLVGDVYRLRLSDLNDKAQARVPSSVGVADATLPTHLGGPVSEPFGARERDRVPAWRVGSVRVVCQRWDREVRMGRSGATGERLTSRAGCGTSPTTR